MYWQEAIDDLADVLTQLVPLTSNTPAPQAPQNTEVCMHLFKNALIGVKHHF
jgi:hypothetical protein